MSDLVGFVPQAFELPMRHAECPVFRIVGRSIGDQVGLIRQRVDVLLELGERTCRRTGTL